MMSMYQYGMLKTYLNGQFYITICRSNTLFFNISRSLSENMIKLKKRQIKYP